MTPGEAGEVLQLCARLEASVASIKALAAARAAEGDGWRHDGFRSPADQLAHQARMSPAAARRALETGRRMSDQPEVASVALAGELSLEQAAAVTDGVAADPGKASELIDTARHASLPELNEAVAKVKAACVDLEARRKQVHSKRCFRRWTDRDGAGQAHLYGHPENLAGLWRVLDPIRRRLNVLRRQAGMSNETLDALDYDALMALASIAAGKTTNDLQLSDLLELGLFPQLDTTVVGKNSDSPPAELFPTDDPDTSPMKDGRRAKKLAGSPMRVMVRVDLDTLLRGVPIEGELCEIAGYGPVPVSVIEDLLATENPFLVGILTKSEEVVGVYHHGRHPNAHQRSALDFIYPTCAAEGCSSRAGLQYDHREDFVKTRITAFDLLDRLCVHHHRKKTNEGWALIEGKGKRPFVPPTDPRHPRTPARQQVGPSPPTEPVGTP
ncbi:MAG: DUF222 domain-containing protein [Acidimicrobiaceae bacterium]|nr:DUF222 domain-containing protein [Acidimicrobiaceae bacterium]